MFDDMAPRLAEAAPAATCSTLDAAVLQEFRHQAPDLAASKFHDVSTGPAFTAVAARAALGISEDARYKGTATKHTRDILTKWVCSVVRDFVVSDRIRRWWEKRKTFQPPFVEYARKLWRRLISTDPANAHLKLSFAEVAKCFQLKTAGDVPPWMTSNQTGTVFDRLGAFEGTSSFDVVVVDRRGTRCAVFGLRRGEIAAVAPGATRSGSAPFATRFNPAQVIDEAQDLNPTHKFLFVDAPRARDARRVLVGDAFQSLYHWRGARNALQLARPDATEEIELTASFRFGEEIAELATTVLQRCAPEGEPEPKKLRGCGEPGRLQFENGRDCHDWRADPLAIIGRNNKNVLLAADE